MTYRLQMLHALIEAHPDRADRLKVHVDALESTITGEPERCLERVRALFEATYHTIAPALGLGSVAGEDFPAQNSRIIKALDFTLDGHPEAERIGETIRKLVGSINGTVSALAELSNISGMRHGGSLDWRTLQRQHAVMLGGLCDTLVSFLFDAAWSRATAAEPNTPNYGDHADFDGYLDSEHDVVEIAGATFEPSRVLFQLDRTIYDAVRVEWELARATEEETDEEAAA
ncbi:abortive infection family protein [Bradyrhizobium liaoningense]|uniref:abortive infection family protein n=1 Tax=Bradyrhizobium liaoningense TaxID=43992 RepID=UPI001BAE51D9|nr:abortive infection family protein [Bradyrhizobium liaoningense]MBR0988232.1 abortive infection family protein [Bradyrhizobium liaoningense]